jgi:hypothetical protein
MSESYPRLCRDIGRFRVPARQYSRRCEDGADSAGMSLGLFGVILVGTLVVLSLDRGNRLRTVVTGLVGVMLGLVIAGSNGVLVEPAHKLVDGVRAGLTAVGQQIAGDDKHAESAQAENR